jgi:hypothetical protein
VHIINKGYEVRTVQEKKPIISTVALSGSNESVALGILEITSIPHYSVVSGMDTPQEVIERFQAEFCDLLSEIHQQYKRDRQSKDANHLLSIELLWLTQKVEYQSFKAKIRLLLILRAIGTDHVSETVSAGLRLCAATLTTQKYEFNEVSYSEVSPLIAAINRESIVAIQKEVRIEDMQSGLMRQCIVFDRIEPTKQGLGRVAHILTDNPDCAVSFQLMATEYTTPEIYMIDGYNQNLSMMKSGLLAPGIGQVTNTLAERPSATYGYYSNHKKGHLFTFNVIIYGTQSGADAISSRLIGQINAGSSSPAMFSVITIPTEAVDIKDNFYPLPWAVSEALMVGSIFPGNLSTGIRLPHIITAEEASNFFRLPIGSEDLSAGFDISGSERSKKTFASSIINGADLNVGLLQASKKDQIGIFLDDLTKHMLVVGTPGSGKTTYLTGLLEQLWKEHQIPFLIIEPAKNEYRAMLERIPDLQIFTVGNSNVSPFVFNPFVPPKNVRLESYKTTLKTAFAAAATMTSPLDRIFEESINNCFSDFFWLDSYTADDYGEVFNISDFIACFQKTFEAIGYTGEVRNIGQAGLVRLQGMAALFDNYYSIPIEDILSKPTVIELAAVENEEQKSLIMALLLLSVSAYVNANYTSGQHLRNVILLEEAHVLLDSYTNRMQGEANPSGIAQALVKRMLAEIRAYGVGMIIADQSPRKVTADVISMTDIKLSFRIVEAEDRRMMADSTGMNDAKYNRLLKLKPGEAYFYFQRLDEPEEIVTPNFRASNNIPFTISDDKVREKCTYWRDKETLIRPYPECGYSKYCTLRCDLHTREVARQVARRIFSKNLNEGTRDNTELIKLFSSIHSCIQKELNKEPISPIVEVCSKIHLWRRIKYHTKLNITPENIKNSVKKE